MNLQPPTSNGQQTANLQRPMTSGLGFGVWKFVGRWLLVVGGSAAGGLLGGCCAELRKGVDDYNAGVALRSLGRDDLAAGRFERARRNLQDADQRCGLDAAEQLRVRVMMARIDLYAGGAGEAVRRIRGPWRSSDLPPIRDGEDPLLSLFRAESAVRDGHAILDRMAASPTDPPLQRRLLEEAIRSFAWGEEHLRRASTDAGIKDLAVLWTGLVRFEKAKAMELHDEKTRPENLTAAGAELEALAKDMRGRAPEHPDLLREYEELKGKVADERERVAKALGR